MRRRDDTRRRRLSRTVTRGLVFVTVEDDLLRDEAQSSAPAWHSAQSVGKDSLSEFPNGPAGDVAAGEEAEHRAVADGAAAARIGPAEHVGRGVAGGVQPADRRRRRCATDLAVAVDAGPPLVPSMPGMDLARRRTAAATIGAHLRRAP